MYADGLGLEVIGNFEKHDGFDGVMLGTRNSQYHFEFTQELGHAAPKSPSEDLLVVFYIPNEQEWNQTAQRILMAGFTSVSSRNPYWDLHGKTYEDLEGYRVVLSKQN